MEVGVEELVVVGFAAKRATEFDRQFRYMDVKESLVWAIGWFAGPKRGR